MEDTCYDIHANISNITNPQLYTECRGEKINRVISSFLYPYYSFSYCCSVSCKTTMKNKLKIISLISIQYKLIVIMILLPIMSSTEDIPSNSTTSPWAVSVNYSTYQVVGQKHKHGGPVILRLHQHLHPHTLSPSQMGSSEVVWRTVSGQVLTWGAEKRL